MTDVGLTRIIEIQCNKQIQQTSIPVKICFHTNGERTLISLIDLDTWCSIFCFFSENLGTRLQLLLTVKCVKFQFTCACWDLLSKTHLLHRLDFGKSGPAANRSLELARLPGPWTDTKEPEDRSRRSNKIKEIRSYEMLNCWTDFSSQDCAFWRPQQASFYLTPTNWNCQISNLYCQRYPALTFASPNQKRPGSVQSFCAALTTRLSRQPSVVLHAKSSWVISWDTEFHADFGPRGDMIDMTKNNVLIMAEKNEFI